MLGNLTGWHLVIILVIVLLLFGATRLPALTRSIGQSVRIFKKEVRDDDASKPSDPGSDYGVRTDSGVRTDESTVTPSASARRDADTTP
ncbi:sec-independent protein translocase protein TatA [Labedella gwakjiensis]|uniref:Sec-independent protein translocase protein TatA n=1 Tax=Labedella gwakjiensis TaxID=390269 RepID=A0A2P8H033_9MICO|nr:twin-arginine translocase TatA/TatE family subunit [Labedella gwakjiensis]PSL39566.1 sec-independent protein translocase protein TatA [Labedella gwakjiensis]RUQ86038.1 twin-arginine translocase TatA/TatE family subunit [Labedella gwakjiensis]